MQKLSKQTLELFDKDITSILSKKRLESYEGSLEAHYKNLKLAFEAGKRIANLEIFLRNKLDFCLKRIEGENWIKEQKALAIIRQKGQTPLIELETHQILSGLMLGEVIELIRAFRVESYMFELKNMDFKNYHWSNKNFCRINGKRTNFSNLDKNIIVFNLIRNIRNRAFHWENLLKITQKENGDIFPRITHKENGSTIGVMPEKILDFLDDLITCIGNDTLKSYVR